MASNYAEEAEHHAATVEWQPTGDADALISAIGPGLRAVAYALLDVAAAIREHGA